MKCHLCSLDTDYRVLISTHRKYSHPDVDLESFKLNTLSFNNVNISNCKTCNKPITVHLNRKRQFCSRECYAPKVITEKKCKKCNVTKILSEFHAAKRNVGGVRSVCKSCSKCTTKTKKKHKSRNTNTKIIQNTRSLMWHQINNGGYSKRSRTQDYLGISFDGFKKHLESQFEPWMNWDNYGVDGWTIDHICPCTQALNAEEFYRLLHYTNCRPLDHKMNIAKGNAYSVEAENMCIKLLGRSWVGYTSKKDLVILAGVSGAGKSWVLKSLNNPLFETIDSDKISKKDLVISCLNSNKIPILSLTSGISTFIKNNSIRFNFKVIIINPDQQLIESNLKLRNSSITDSIISRIARMRRLIATIDNKVFTTSSDALHYLSKISSKEEL